MANVIPILILDPFFPKQPFASPEEKRKKRSTSAHLGGFSPNPHSASAATLDSKEPKKKKEKKVQRSLSGWGAVIVTHTETV